MQTDGDIKVIGKRVKRLRIESGFSKAQLARNAKVSISTLNQLERGVGNPLLSTLYRLSMSLNTKLHILCKDT